MSRQANGRSALTAASTDYPTYNTRTRHSHNSRTTSLRSRARAHTSMHAISRQTPRTPYRARPASHMRRKHSTPRTQQLTIGLRYSRAAASPRFPDRSHPRRRARLRGLHSGPQRRYRQSLSGRRSAPRRRWRATPSCRYRARPRWASRAARRPPHAPW